LRKDVHDDRLPRTEGSRADHVRVRRLWTGRDDRALGRASELEQPPLDDRSQPLRREDLSVELERAVDADGRASDRVDAVRPGVFRRVLRALERGDLLVALRTAALDEVVGDDQLE